MLHETLDRIDERHLLRVCADRYAESQTLDFKQTLPGNGDKDKHEFVKDVCSLANADGGDLVYGIREAAGSASALVPIVGEELDDTKRRLAQLLDSGAEPRVDGVRFHGVAVESGFVLVVRVPASFDGPHSIRNNTNRRFVMRNGTSTSDLTFEQLRSAFGRSATLADKARGFIAGRHERIASGLGSKRVVGGPMVAVHIAPMSGIAGRFRADLDAIHGTDYTHYIGEDWGGGSRSFNLDGVVVYPGGRHDDSFETYRHFFRDGSFETVRIVGGNVALQHGVAPQLVVYSRDVTSFVRDSVSLFAKATQRWACTGPAVLSLAAFHVEAHRLTTGDVFRPTSRDAADRPRLAIPETWIPEVDAFDVDATVRPLLDIFWQSFGLDRCPHFDKATGAFLPARR